jgi:hypothetical protein
MTLLILRGQAIPLSVDVIERNQKTHRNLQHSIGMVTLSHHSQHPGSIEDLPKRLLSEIPAQGSAGSCTRVLTLPDRFHPVHKHPIDPLWVSVGVRECSLVDHGRWIEDNQIRKGARADLATIREGEFPGRQAGHLVDGFLQRE